MNYEIKILKLFINIFIYKFKLNLYVKFRHLLNKIII